MEGFLDIYGRAAMVVAAIAVHRSVRQSLTLDRPGRPFLRGPVPFVAVLLVLLFGISQSADSSVPAALSLLCAGGAIVLISSLLRPQRHVFTAQVPGRSVATELLRDLRRPRLLGVEDLHREPEPPVPAGHGQLILRDGVPTKGKPSSRPVVPADPSGVRSATGSRLVTPNPDA